MRLVKCDVCGAEVQLTEYGIPPPGWVQILVQGPMLQRPPDLCTEQCAAVWMGRKRAASAARP